MATTKPDWPESEPIPRSMAEALMLGWEVIGHTDQEPSARSETGMKVLGKYVGSARLTICVPYRVTYKFGKPCKPEAFPMHDDDIEDSCRVAELEVTELERLYGKP